MFSDQRTVPWLKLDPTSKVLVWVWLLLCAQPVHGAGSQPARLELQVVQGWRKSECWEGSVRWVVRVLKMLNLGCKQLQLPGLLDKDVWFELHSK